MGYLVIKNGTNKKSYHTTTECDRPRLKAGAGYIPFTKADKSSFNLHVTAESSSSSGEYYTVTTGTSYLYSTYTTKVTHTYTTRYTTFTQNGTTGGSVVEVGTRETVINVTSSKTTGTSYLTDQQNNTASAKITVSNLADYKSYTYTGEQGTVTTGTTYLTRASTSSTVYGTKQSILSSDIKRVYTTAPAYVYGSFAWTHNYEPGPNDTPYTSSYSKYGLEYVDGPAHTISVIRTVDYLCSFNNFHGPVSGTLYTSSDVWGIGVYLSGSVTHNISVRFSSKSTKFNKYLCSTLSTVYTSTVATTGTSYQTRASTSGTSYGTKTTNKTLTSSSWG